jgi:hypothetical protein
MLTVKSRDGQTLKVKMADNVAVRGVAKASFVKPGAKIFIAAANKKEDGTLEAAAINVGRDGITPPM